MEFKVLTPAERVGEYLKLHGYDIRRMDIYGMTANGYFEFVVRPNGEFAMQRGAEGQERIRIWREWKDRAHGLWVAKELK